MPAAAMATRLIATLRWFGGTSLDGYVTIQGARDDYGVVIDPATLMVDLAATRGNSVRHDASIPSKVED